MYSQFMKFIRMELLCLKPVEEARALSVQPFLNPLGGIYMDISFGSGESKVREGKMILQTPVRKP